MSNPLIPDTKLATFITKGTGAKTTWDINFASGYLDKTHVKAFITHLDGRIETISPVQFIAPQTVQIIPAVPLNAGLTIYRDTPKAAALVDYTGGSIINETNLDTTARQGVFVAAEVMDRLAGVNEMSEKASADAAGAVVAAAAAGALASTASSNATLTLSRANTAITTANAADTKATSALNTSNSFNMRLTKVESDSTVALQTAQGVDAKATTALNNSGVALTVANQAAVQANSAQMTAQAVDAKASAALSNSQTANQNASVALAAAQNVDAKADLAIQTANTANTQVQGAVNASAAANTKADAAVAAVANKQDKLNFTPVQQGGGTGQNNNNKIYLGWSGTGLRLQVDGTDFGPMVYEGRANTWTLQQTHKMAVRIDGDTERVLNVDTAGSVAYSRWGANADWSFAVMNRAASAWTFRVYHTGEVRNTGTITAESGNVVAAGGTVRSGAGIVESAGSNSPLYRFVQVAGASRDIRFAGGTGGADLYFTSTGGAQVATLANDGTWFATNFTIGSDRRLKDSWRPFGTDVLSRLSNLKRGTYRLKSNDKRYTGLCANALQKQFPDAVRTDPQGYLGIDQGFAAAMVAELGSIVQRLSQRVADLEAKLEGKA